jgi:maleylacetoacetate isomerase/maleylpyruvate isomerase
MQLFTFWRSMATFRVRIAMNIKGLEADPIYVDLLRGHQATPEFRNLNPAMAVPALVDDDGTVLTQSTAIIEYLDERWPSPPLLPTDPAGRARVRALAQITVADSHPLSVPRIRKYLTTELGASDQQVVGWARKWQKDGLDAYETLLTGSKATGTFCHGDKPGLADICLASHCIGTVFFYGGTIDGHPTVKRIYERCMADERFSSAHPKRQPDAPPTI